ncbi:hypothetical protein AB205_0210970, partial [Aquarana catesbeiana]
MKELERIVKLYEAYRQALISEVETRKQRQQCVPRYDQPPPLPPPVTYQPRQVERSQPLLVPANPYHTAEIPDWLQVYARAPV